VLLGHNGGVVVLHDFRVDDQAVLVKERLKVIDDSEFLLDTLGAFLNDFRPALSGGHNLVVVLLPSEDHMRLEEVTKHPPAEVALNGTLLDTPPDQQVGYLLERLFTIAIRPPTHIEEEYPTIELGGDGKRRLIRPVARRVYRGPHRLPVGERLAHAPRLVEVVPKEPTNDGLVDAEVIPLPPNDVVGTLLDVQAGDHEVGQLEGVSVSIGQGGVQH